VGIKLIEGGGLVLSRVKTLVGFTDYDVIHSPFVRFPLLSSQILSWLNLHSANSVLPFPPAPNK